MEHVLSYRFDAMDDLIRRDIQATSARIAGALQDLSRQIAPLLQTWTREAATAYRDEQHRWHRAAAALNDILVELGNAVRDGAGELAHTDRQAANSWRR
ncbi:WXG100 family type VII secretion target [Mycolicibacillus trivialis]|uniref:ESAT-6-like protein n=1 Tax=Mycolicibacillus trivialis TaxID=1798 RepID=A0A1X2EH86_9MYCO|nr:WXG100 family type VII secretion target [Mycolicibacillus trivialis]ORX02116.1 type VII secretion protein EsxT [Mycolicibacillus trivialis]